MTTAKSHIQPIQISLGVQPSQDRTRFNTNHYTLSSKVRSWQGSVEVIGGWSSVVLQNDAVVSGTARTMYSGFINNISSTVIGTSKYFYSLYGGALTNISPLLTATTTIANSISTDYATLASDPIATTIGTGKVVVTDPDYDRYIIGDSYTLSGASTTNGITNTLLNNTHSISEIGTGTIIFYVNGTATSTGSGGGASVIKKTGLIEFSAASHGQNNGDRTKITDAADTGGILAALINIEHIVRNADTNVFSVMTTGTASSAVTAGGGASTKYQKQIAYGDEDENFGIGWGVGLWGVGLWGVRSASLTKTYPRIWSIDRFGDRIIASAGNQSGIYVWDGSINTAPTLLTNAPTTINYVFVSDNVVVTLGYDGVPNQIFASDQGDPTEWTASSLNQVYQDVIEGAGRLISHVPVLGINLLFTPSQTYRFSKIDINAGVWETKLLDNSIGIIAQNARVSVNNTAYWMGRDNFFMWSGGNIQVIPANDQNQCTALNYVFRNINTSQLSKCFAWYNAKFHEVWFHYPSASSNECDRVVRVSLVDNSWWVDTFDRTCAEYPSAIFGNPRLVSSTGVIYEHETGYTADGADLEWSVTSNLRMNGKKTKIIPGLIPDSTQSNEITVKYSGYAFPQSQLPSFEEEYAVTSTTERVATQLSGRFWQYTWSGIGAWNMGQWLEYVQEGAGN